MRALRALIAIAVLAVVPAEALAACPTLGPPKSAGDPATAGFTAGPPYGRAPLQVRMGWWTYPVEDPVSFEIEIDGAPASRAATDTGVSSHTFTQPGPHTVAGRVIDRTGRAVTRAVSIEVKPAADFDREVSTLWAAFKAALARGDVGEALECVTSHARDRARATLAPGGPRVREVLSHADTLTFAGKVSSVDLEYRTDFVGGRALPLVLSPDIDDVWRFDAGGWTP